MSSWAGEPEQMGVDRSSGQCREGERRAIEAPRVEGLEMERDGEGLQARKGRMKPM